MSVDVAGLVQKLLTKLSNSRDFTISAALHAVLIALFGGTVLYRAVQEPPDFEGEWGGFVQPNEVACSSGDAATSAARDDIQRGGGPRGGEFVAD